MFGFVMQYTMMYIVRVNKTTQKLYLGMKYKREPIGRVIHSFFRYIVVKFSKCLIDLYIYYCL